MISSLGEMGTYHWISVHCTLLCFALLCLVLEVHLSILLMIGCLIGCHKIHTYQNKLNIICNQLRVALFQNVRKYSSHYFIVLVKLYYFVSMKQRSHKSGQKHSSERRAGAARGMFK